MTEEQLLLIEKTANTLRGMTMDPRIPADTKDCMRLLFQELEAALEAAM
jgi:hypothetical protein